MTYIKKQNNIILGTYPQNNESLKKEPIEWIILKESNSSFLCVSKYLLDCEPYNKSLEDITWENCTLRKWLNTDFLYTAFTKEEQSRIQITNIETPLHNTKDYIFLLSCDEAETYFDFAERAVKTTLYARKQGAWFLDDYKDEHHNNGTWWLRYPNTLNKDIVKGESDLYTVLSCVNFDGYIEGAAEEVTGTRCCVRPAFWLKAE